MVNNVPAQGDIIKINLDPKQGHEQKGYRPYICLSHHLVSDYANIAVFALISNTARRYPLYISLKKTKTTGVVLLDQLVTIDYNARQFTFIETVDDDCFAKGTYPALQGVKKGMYPETNTLPKQHTSSLQGEVVDFLDDLLKRVVVVFQNNNK